MLKQLKPTECPEEGLLNIMLTLTALEQFCLQGYSSAAFMHPVLALQALYHIS
jgi:hypothetical protein